MSDYYVNVGYMAVLAEAVDESDWDKKNDDLYNAGDKLALTYDGTIIYSTDINTVLYEFDMCIGNPSTVEDFIMRCKSNGFVVDVPTIQPYTSAWYNGADSPMSCTTLQSFLKKCK